MSSRASDQSRTPPTASSHTQPDLHQLRHRPSLSVPSFIWKITDSCVKCATKGNESYREQWRGDNRKVGGHAATRLSDRDSYSLQTYHDKPTFVINNACVIAMSIA